MWRELSTNDKMIPVAVEKRHFLEKTILTNFYHFCSQIDFNFYEVTYQHTPSPIFDRVATPVPSNLCGTAPQCWFEIAFIILFPMGFFFNAALTTPPPHTNKVQYIHTPISQDCYTTLLLLEWHLYVIRPIPPVHRTLWLYLYYIGMPPPPPLPSRAELFHQSRNLPPARFTIDLNYL